MNQAAQLVMTDIATVWPNNGKDEYQQITYGTPFTIPCSFREGGKLTRDDMGDQFVPMSTFRAFVSPVLPKKGDIIALGDLTANATPSGLKEAQTIRKVVTKTPFRCWTKRYNYLTG